MVGGPDHLLHEKNSLSMGELLGQNKVRKVISYIYKDRITNFYSSHLGNDCQEKRKARVCVSTFATRARHQQGQAFLPFLTTKRRFDNGSLASFDLPGDPRQAGMPVATTQEGVVAENSHPGSIQPVSSLSATDLRHLE